MGFFQVNNCGIALLEVVGKVVARVIQARLQGLAEEELPKSLCGFRKGHGCADMIIAVHQLTEKAIEHHFFFCQFRKHLGIPSWVKVASAQSLGTRFSSDTVCIRSSSRFLSSPLHTLP